MPDPLLHIRTADAGDADLLASFGAQTFREAFAPDNTPQDMAAYLAGSFGPERQAAELADRGTTFLIAERAGETVGYARLKLGPAPACIVAGRPAEIVRLYAAAEWIGRGVGAALMRACLERAGELRCDAVWLDVWEKNPRAIAFYRRWGFVEVGTQEFVLGGDVQHDLLMQRRLDPEPAGPSRFPPPQADDGD